MKIFAIIAGCTSIGIAVLKITVTPHTPAHRPDSLEYQHPGKEIIPPHPPVATPVMLYIVPLPQKSEVV